MNLHVKIATVYHCAVIGNLYHVPAWNCLNQEYLKMLLQMDLEDDICEKCIAFDPLLKFWYDNFWVQEIPIGRTNASKVFRSGKQSVGPNKEEVKAIVHKTKALNPNIMRLYSLCVIDSYESMALNHYYDAYVSKLCMQT